MLDRSAGAPAAAVDHLLVGEHGLIDGIPIDRRLLPRDETGCQEVQEKRLLMLVIARIAGCEFARPVERQAHRFELRAHRVDVGVSPCRRMRGALHRGGFRRQAEGVPAHRMQHVETAGALVARYHVAHRVIADVAHMDAAGGVRKHLQRVVFRTRVRLRRLEGVAVAPDLLPCRLGFAEIVTFGPHVLNCSRSWRDMDLISRVGSMY